jgi:replicative DNA helicase
LNYETRLLNAIIDTSEYVEAVNSGVENVFIEYRDVWNFIVSHYDDHGKVPSKDTVKSHFSDFDFLSTSEPLAYYVDEAKRESLSFQTRQIVAKAHSLIGDAGPKDALAYLMEQTSKLYKFSSSLKDTDLVSEWRDRYLDLKERSENPDKQYVGIPSGIDVIDKTFGGWQEGDFIVLLGWTGVGKSFIARLFAVNAWKAGYRPMIISLEMNKKQEGQRLDTLLNNGEGYFTNTDLIKANPDIVGTYESWAENTFEGKHPIYLITSEGLETADQNMVQAKIDQYQPDLVILDYHGLFDDASGARNETEKAKNLSKAFKRIAVKNNVPIIDVAAVTMADGHGDRPPELEEVAWSKQLAYDADLVLAIHREFNSDLFQVVSRKVRRATHFGFYLRWNLETGKWAEEWDVG